MCVEKTPWEQVIDFHGHSCPEIAIGYRIAQIAQRELGIRPAPDSQVIVLAKTHSCAVDSFQILNKATFGRGNLLVEELGKHIYEFQFSGTNDILMIEVNSSILEGISSVDDSSSPRHKQNKILEAIQLILSSKEEDFCSIQRQSGNLTS